MAATYSDKPSYDDVIEASMPDWGFAVVTREGALMQWDASGMDADAEPHYVQVN